MAKKVKENESVFVDVDVNGDAVSVTNAAKDVDSHCGLDAVAEAINEVPKKQVSKRGKTSVKKVADLALENRISDLENALGKAKGAIEGVSADNERLADELVVSVAENKSLRKELSKVRQDYKKCQGDNRANTALIETINGELTRQKTQNNELRETISRLQDKIKQYADELSRKQETINTCKSYVSNRDNLIDEMRKKNSILVDEIAKFRSMKFFDRFKFMLGICKK